MGLRVKTFPPAVFSPATVFEGMEIKDLEFNGVTYAAAGVAIDVNGVMTTPDLDGTVGAQDGALDATLVRARPDDDVHLLAFAASVAAAAMLRLNQMTRR